MLLESDAEKYGQEERQQEPSPRLSAATGLQGWRARSADVVPEPGRLRGDSKPPTSISQQAACNSAAQSS